MEMDNLLNEEQLEATEKGLASWVFDLFLEADAKRGDEFYLGLPMNEWFDKTERRFLAQDGNHEFNLSRIKAGAVVAKARDMVINSVDAPFTLGPTPIPELSEKDQEKIEGKIQEDLYSKLLEENAIIEDPVNGVIPNYAAIMEDDFKLTKPAVEWLEEQAVKQHKTAYFEKAKLARKKTDKAKQLMHDQMLQGNWKNACLACLEEMFKLGTGVIRFELRENPTLKWEGGALVQSSEPSPYWRHVRSQNLYPAPDCTDAQNGSYVIERTLMSESDLGAASKLDWIIDSKVEQALERNQTHNDWVSIGLGGAPSNTNQRTNNSIEVLIFEGSVSGGRILKFLAKADKEACEEFVAETKCKAKEFYDFEIVMAAGVVVGVRMIQSPMGHRSYFSCVYERAGDSFWGLGTIMKGIGIEDRLCRYLTDMDKNVDRSVDPPIFINAAFFDNPEEASVTKGKEIPFTPDISMGPDVGRPFYQTRFDSKTAELMNLFNRFYRLADDETGVPGMLSGNSDMFGGEQTFRGMKMLSANANTLIKSGFLNFDETLVQKAVEVLWRWNMVYTDDDDIKADAKVVARGASGLLQQEIANAEKMEILPVVVNIIKQAGLPEHEAKAVLQYLLKDVMQQGGIPVDELLTDPEVKLEQERAVSSAGGAILPQASLQPATVEPSIGANTSQGGFQ